MTYDLHDVYNDLENTIEELKVDLEDMDSGSHNWNRATAKILVLLQKKSLFGDWIKRNLIAHQNGGK